MGLHPEFTARVESRHGIAWIALQGTLDATVVPALERHLRRAEHDAVVGLIVDLRDLESIDSSGLRTFLAGKERSAANGHRFLLVGAGADVRQVMEATGVEGLLDEQEAVSLFDRFIGGRAREAADVERDGGHHG